MGNQKIVTLQHHSEAARRPIASATLCAAPQQVPWPIWPIVFLNMLIQFHMHTHTHAQSTAIPTLDHNLYEGASRSCDVVLGVARGCAVLWRCMAEHPIVGVARRSKGHCGIFSTYGTAAN